MKSIVLGMLALVLAVPVRGQSGEAPVKPASEDERKIPATHPALVRPVIPPRAELEKRFAETLTGAVLQGIWQMTTDGLEGKGPLSEPKPERYTIVKASKAYGDYWMIQARIEFGDKDVTVPVPVRVVWAEDTPIITLNNLPIPGIGTYSARVMFFADFYSGTWFSTAKNYGGILSGRVVRDSAPPVKQPNEK